IFLRGRMIIVPTDDGTVLFAPGYTGQDATVYRYQLGAQNPCREFDLIRKEDGKERRFGGVYSLEGDTLRICVTVTNGWREHDLEAGPNRLLIVAKRVK